MEGRITLLGVLGEGNEESFRFWQRGPFRDLLLWLVEERLGISVFLLRLAKRMMRVVIPGTHSERSVWRLCFLS